MAVFLTDTFTDTSNLAISSHVGESGDTWVQHPVNTSGDMRISNANRCRVAVAGSALSLFYSTQAPVSADYTLQTIMRAVSVPGSGYAGIAGRVDTSASTYVWVIYNLGAGQWQLWETFAGNSVMYASYTQTLSAGTDYVLKLKMVGVVVTAAIDGVDRMTFNTAVAGPGRPGLAGFGAWDDSTGLHFDSITASDYAQLHYVGDSVAAGLNASDAAHAWPALLGVALDLDAVGNPVSATQIADQCTQSISAARNQVYFTTTSALDIWAWHTGYNDVRYFGTGANGLEAYTRILRAAVAWLSRDRTDCYQASNGAWTFTGSWNDFTAANVATKYTASPGDKCSISISGTAITVAYLSRWGLGDGASFTVKIDGATVETINSNFGATGGYGSGSPTQYVMMAKRYGGLASGTHTVELEMTTAGIFQIGFVTGNGETTKPEVRLCGPLKMNPTGYSSNSPYDQGSDAAVAAYAAAIVAICRDAYTDGRIVKYANINAYYSITEVDTDNVHPADTGHAHIKDAFLAAAVLPPGGGLLLKLPPMSFRPSMSGAFQG